MSLNNGRGLLRRLLQAFFAAALVALFLGRAAWAQSGPVIRAVAAVDQDGCPFCCDFNCRATPSPTPVVDAQGRLVFVRESGRFLFVVEGGPGASGRGPSTAGTSRSGVSAPLLGNGLPGLQALVNRPLGNGSTAVECNSQLLGGVPAVPALDFSPQPSTKNALIDMACRYEWTQSSGPCTRDRFGGFAFLDSGTTLQYCFQVPVSATFAAGETVVALRLADSTGAVGPTRQVVVRVGTVAATPTPTPTPVQRALSGQIALFNGARALPGAQLLMNGVAAATTTGLGNYSLSTSSGATTTLRPRLQGGVGAAVSALDAAYVLQATAGLRTLSTAQRLACDVSGNGAVSTLDASLILQRIVGLGGGFPVAGLCGGDWVFQPLAAAAPNQLVVQPSVNGTTCQQGEIRYQPLVADAANQHFLAAAYGDCTGNWAPGSGGVAAALRAGGKPGVRLGRWRRSRGGHMKVPVYIDSEESFSSAVLEVEYAAASWTPRPLRKLATLGTALLQTNTDPDMLRIAIAAAQPIDSQGKPILVLTFEPTRRRRRQVDPITAFRASVDER